MSTFKQGLFGKYCIHPFGFMLVIPSGENISSKKIQETICAIHSHYNCLFSFESINGSYVVRPHSELPRLEPLCRCIVRRLCRGINIGDIRFSDNLVEYDTSGKLQEAMSRTM